jgi:hypothetical protein
MATIEVKTPVGKAVAGTFFGILALVFVIAGLDSSEPRGIIVGLAFGAVSFLWFRAAVRHQKYLQSRSDKLP